jgi:hypothetical protein
MDLQKVCVTVDESYVLELDAVAERCRRVGMLVDAVMDDLGVITGRIAPGLLPRLADVTGVAYAEPTRNG